jgi:oligopeptide/dipeptide ABC transporter ATP-binding protein
MSDAPLLAVRDLRVGFATEGGLLQAVDRVSFDLSPGEVLAIVGESGSGKSVTAQTMIGLTRSKNSRIEGSVKLEGEELLDADDATMRRLRGEEIGMVFQDPMTSFNPVYRLGAQIVEAIRAHKEDVGKKQARRRVVELFEAVGIPDAERRIDDYPHEFSGGMRQRAMIAMALALEPEVLIADEPTTALDVTIQAQILTILRELVAEQDAALILITHDLGVVAGMCERVNVMYAGLFMETGSAEQLFGTPRHPYTLGLLQSVPRLDAARRTRLHPIEGAPRNMLEEPTACPFQPRCRYEVDRSRLEVPPLVEVEDGHFVACFNPVAVDEWQRTREAATA